MKYPEQYRAELLNAIQNTDLHGVDEAIEMLRETRAHGHCIFVCGSDGSAAVASRFLCEMVKESSLNRSMRFHIVALTDELPTGAGTAEVLAGDRVFVEQLKNVAEAGDLLIGISSSGNSPNVLRAFEYANRIGCRTISIAKRNCGKLATMSNVSILVPASHAASVEDVHMIVCHMIGYYFVNFDRD